jgi:hypothetical protein
LQVDDGIGQVFGNVFNGLADTLTEVASLVTISQFASFVSSGAGTAWNGSATNRAVFQFYVHFNGRIAAAVQDFPGTYGRDRHCHLGLSFPQYSLDVWREDCLRLDNTRLAGRFLPESHTIGHQPPRILGQNVSRITETRAIREMLPKTSARNTVEKLTGSECEEAFEFQIRGPRPTVLVSRVA